MIFVTVGNATQGFRRLLDAVDRLAGELLFGDEEVFIQSGNNSDFVPLNCKHEPFVQAERFNQLIDRADLVISHAGAGTLVHVLKAGKTPVVMPRRKQYRELVDDHQLELVKALAFEGRVIPAYEPHDLAGAIAEAKQRNAQPLPPAPSRMIALVAEAIEELMARKSQAGKLRR